ncbi:MAG: hypothetical protein IT370_33190 [Deltaproteobacteria bacterium]|nr:hypothetical protein [Deltaproteobacteria bacterium]
MELVGVMHARLAGSLEELAAAGAIAGLATVAQARSLLNAPAPQPASLRALTELAYHRQLLLERRVEATRQRRWSIPLLDALQTWGVVDADRWIVACLLAHEVASPLRRVGSLLSGGDALTVEVLATVALGGGTASVVELWRWLAPGEALHDLGLVELGPPAPWLRRQVMPAQRLLALAAGQVGLEPGFPGVLLRDDEAAARVHAALSEPTRAGLAEVARAGAGELIWLRGAVQTASAALVHAVGDPPLLFVGADAGAAPEVAAALPREALLLGLVPALDASQAGAALAGALRCRRPLRAPLFLLGERLAPELVALVDEQLAV